MALSTSWALRAVSLPLVLEGRQIGLRFDADELTGVRLRQLDHPEAGSTFAFRFLPVQDWRLWELTCTLQSGKEVSVHPGQGWKGFTALTGLTEDGAHCAVFRWQGVVIPEATDGDTLDVEVRVTLAEHDNVSRWWSRVTRVRGRSASIDRVDLPVLFLEGPVQPQPGVSHLDAQKGGRVIVPHSFLEGTPFLSQNTCLWLWMAGGGLSELTHPGFQTCQFSAIAAMDPGDPASFRRMLFFGSEDTEGFVKSFFYRGLVQGQKGAFELRARHVPAFSEDPVRGDRNGLDNSYASPYPTVVGAVHARSDAFWYDAAAQYRGFVERSGLGGVKREHNHRLSSLRGNALLVGNIQYVPRKFGAELFYSFLKATADLRQVLLGDDSGGQTVFMHVQNVLRNAVGIKNPDYPVHESVDPDLRAIVMLAFRQGIRTSGYSEGLRVPPRSRWRRFLSRADRVHRRDGSLLHPTEFWFDFGSENAQRFPADHMQKDMAELCRFSGMYLDGVSGVFTFLAYDPTGALRPTHAPHGGTYATQGKIRLFDSLRETLRRTAPGQTEHGDPEVYLMSETAQEYLVGHLDFTQEGYIFVPNHMLLAEEISWATSLVPLGLERVPLEARNMSPPLWSAVYHEWAPTCRLAIPLSSNGLATNFRRFPVGPYPGLSATEWVDLLVFLHACPFMAGMNWMLAHIEDVDPMFHLEDGQVRVDEEIDPERTGATILAGIGTMARAQDPRHAGEFLAFGQMERPLQVDYQDPDLRLVRNPVNASRKAGPADYGSTLPSYARPYVPEIPFEVGWPWVSGDFPVVQVSHSVWRSHGGKLGMVFFNWSSEDGSWRGLFDPSLYGWEPGDRVRVLRRNPDGTERVVGVLRRRARLRIGAPVARRRGELDLGPLPPRSLLVIVAERILGAGLSSSARP